MEEQVLILHDTTAMQFNGDRQGLGRLQTSAKGFFLHASLAVRLDRSPLGVLGANAWVRPEQGPPSSRLSLTQVAAAIVAPQIQAFG